MSIINTVAREIVAKIVYYGPGICGKTTNLTEINQRVAASHRGRLISLATDQDRTLFFDVLPVKAGKVKGFDLRFQLFTVPGQVYYNASRRTVLTNADGIVFVADSHPSRYEANIDSMQNLYDNCAALGLTLDPAKPNAIPVVLQYNKRDVPGALPVDMLEQALNFEGWPAWEAVAARGIGVFETLGDIMRLVEARLRR